MGVPEGVLAENINENIELNFDGPWEGFFLHGRICHARAGAGKNCRAGGTV
jgi:hypothetical protein